ncbi:ATP-binding domain-containing protein [[Leptolyngbya] sp. PCC 7376]|uniref:Dph6-related ATP pyrophosphatase n=1 Tax=[Leptolyngbya] sp. PCC 7376 TaxID=111781 RepID=UPI0005A11A21|nr:ATP-binding domain-containing protein [[Leptolyngbya] sp. PCC 7376]
MKPKALMSWSSGKDSAWALYQLQQNLDIEVVGLFCMVNQNIERISVHGIRIQLLQQQAQSIDLPLEIIGIPLPCSNVEYEAIMARFVEQAKQEGIQYFAFGDLFLEDARNYRKNILKDSGIKPLFPIWGIPTATLAKTMIGSGLRTMIVCVDTKRMPPEFVGREFNISFLEDLSPQIDLCGENGEFHSFVFDGPMFTEPIGIALGETFTREHLIFVDVLPQNI